MKRWWRAWRCAGPATLLVALGATLAVGLEAAVVLLTPAPAHAHALLVGTSPASGARLDNPPHEVRLRFSERITVAPDGVALRDTTGATLPTGPAVVPAGTPTEVRLPWPAEAGEGTWVVSFRVVSADSHPIAGALVFTVGETPGATGTTGTTGTTGATGATGAAAAALEVALAGDPEDPALPVAFAVARWAGYAGLALLAGCLVGFVLWWPEGWTDRRARRLVALGWATSLAGAAGSLLLQGPYVAGRSLAAVADPALLPATLGTGYGHYLLARLILLIAAGALVWAAPRLSPRTRSGPALLLGVALPVTWVGTGHSSTAGSPADFIVDAAHLVAMATWFGGLALLAACLLPRSAARPAAEVTPVLRRFSLLATAAVATLVGTGGYLAWREVGSLAALAGTQYGRLLAFKLALVGSLVWFGAMSRSIVQRRYHRPPPISPAEPAATRSRRRAARTAAHGELQARAQLRQSVRLEVGTAVAVLALASVLVATPPGTVANTAGAAAASAAGPVVRELALGEGGGTVQVRLDPAWSGENQLEVAISDPAGAPWDVPEVTASFALPAADLGPLPVELTRIGPGSYQAASATVPVAGAWQLRLAVRTSEIDSTTVLAEVPVA